MKKKKAFILLLFIFISIVSYAQTPPIVYVAGDGSGDFNCDGDSAQIQINQALDYVAANAAYTTVFLKGNFKYTINEPIIISSNTIFTGDSSATVYLKDSVGWFENNKPIVGQKNCAGWDSWGQPGDSISNVEIYGFEINGGLQKEEAGHVFIPLIHFYYPYNVKIHHMRLSNSRWDIVRLSSGESGTKINSKVYNNLILGSGHEGICFVDVTNFEAYNNTIYSTRTNCGIRAKNTDTLLIYNNIIGNSLGNNPSGYSGILIENLSTPIYKAEIFENLIYGKNGGIHLGSTSFVGTYDFGTRKNVHIHHNRIFKTRYRETSEGKPMDIGIRINGYHNTLVEHNVIEAGETDGIVYVGTSGGGSGYETIVRNNTIINNGGYGINNNDPSVHTFISNNNLVYNNTLGNYNNTTSTNDVYSEPIFASTHSDMNNWHHIIASYDNATETFKIYIDGIEKASEQFPGFGSIGTNTKYTYLGIFRDVAHWLIGREDEVGIWNRAITADEVSALYNNGIPENYSGSLNNDLQAYFKMENNWNDSSGNGFNAIDSTANFTTDAISGNYAGLFDGSNGVLYPDVLSTTNGLTISAWTYRTDTTGEYQTILNKGSQGQNDHIWLYFRRESVYLELGNGNGDRHSLEANIFDPWDLDFHVKSTTGRWDGEKWVKDNEMSPCIDAGDHATDYTNEPLPNDERANIGVYGNTNEASKSKTSVYYVSMSGDDTNSGLSIAESWKTIRHAANTLTAGDTVYILAGNYTDTARVIVQNSGSIDNYIVFINYQDDVVTLDGTGISWGGTWNGLFDVSQKDYIEINGLQINNSDYAGIWIDEANHIIIKNCSTYNTYSSGIGIWDSRDVSVENNEIELACNDGEQECITVSNSNNCEIFKNHIHDNGPGTNGGEGIDVKQGSHHVKVYQNLVHNLNERIGIYVDAWDVPTYNIDIFNNEVHHCGNNGFNAQSEMGGELSYINFYNNLSYFNKWDGIALGSVVADPNVTVTPVKHVKIINNTCYKNGSYQGGWGYGILVNNDDLQDVLVRNNICSQNSAQIAIEKIDTIQQLDHNLIDGYNGATYCLYGSDSIIGDPVFVDGANFDFHLQGNSPAIDKGIFLDSIGFDFDSIPRPLLANPDIGAYEKGIYWIGEVSNDWHSVGNWSNNVVPIQSDKVTIPKPSFYNFHPEINSNAQVKNIYLNDKSQMIIKENIKFDVLE